MERKRFVQKRNYTKVFFQKEVLEKHDRIPLSKKENKLLDRDIGYKNIDELVEPFNHAETDEEFNELFDKIDNKLTTLKKLF